MPPPPPPPLSLPLPATSAGISHPSPNPRRRSAPLHSFTAFAKMYDSLSAGFKVRALPPPSPLFICLVRVRHAAADHWHHHSLFAQCVCLMLACAAADHWHHRRGSRGRPEEASVEWRGELGQPAGAPVDGDCHRSGGGRHTHRHRRAQGKGAPLQSRAAAAGIERLEWHAHLLRGVARAACDPVFAPCVLARRRGGQVCRTSTRWQCWGHLLGTVCRTVCRTVCICRSSSRALPRT